MFKTFLEIMRRHGKSFTANVKNPYASKRKVVRVTQEPVCYITELALLSNFYCSKPRYCVCYIKMKFALTVTIFLNIKIVHDCRILSLKLAFDLLLYLASTDIASRATQYTLLYCLPSYIKYMLHTAFCTDIYVINMEHPNGL